MVKFIGVFLLTSPTALVKIWMILSCGVATTLCPFISIMQCPTRIPPLSAIPPRIRLQICRREEGGDFFKMVTFDVPEGGFSVILRGFSQ